MKRHQLPPIREHRSPSTCTSRVPFANPEHWVFYLLIFQRNLKRVTAFFSSSLQLPDLTAVSKQLWTAYLDRWRNSSLPLISKFTFSHPGHFETVLKTKASSDAPFEPIPARVRDCLDGRTVRDKDPKEQGVNYDKIFNAIVTQRARGKSFHLKDETQREDIFLRKENIADAAEFLAKSKRRVKSQKKVAKKVQLSGRRRKSSVMSSSGHSDNELVRIIEEMEV